MSIMERIKNRRNELGMTQTELARKAGLQPPAISQYESGVRNPSFEALRKLSYALDVTTDYLMTGIEAKEDKSLDRKNDIIFKVINSLSSDEKDKLLEYAIFLATGKKQSVKAIYSNSFEYARFVLKEYTNNQLPINVLDIADKLGIKIFEDDLQEGEGILIKAEHQVIILDNKIDNIARKKFTLATLLGHSIIPWHLKTTYILRKYDNKIQNNKTKDRKFSNLITGASTLLTEEIQEVEAQSFAHNLIMPAEEIKKDFIENEGTIEKLKKLADEKYKVSFFSLVNRLVEFAPEKYAVIQSENYKIKKTYPGKRTLINEKVDTRSIASSFFENPSHEEEIRTGEVSAEYWLLDAKKGEKIYEESIFNPKYGKVLTLIKIM